MMRPPTAARLAVGVVQIAGRDPEHRHHRRASADHRQRSRVRRRRAAHGRRCIATVGREGDNDPRAQEPPGQQHAKRSHEGDNEQPVPELPDVTVYLEALQSRLLGQRLNRVRLANPFVLRTVEPGPRDLEGKLVLDLRRLGKRIVFGFESDLFLVIHLMIAGRFRWLAAGAKVPGKIGLAALDFDAGTLVLTEAGSKRRASMHIVRGEEALREHDRGGLEPLTMSLDEFRDALTRERHTLKRTLTDPQTFSGIGNAYSDEILHRARLSPVQMSTNLDAEEIERLFHATQTVLNEWIERLRAETGSKFPEKVTAFRPEMAVHGRYNQPCPDCGTPVQRIVYAENETNYCARCQTKGKLLADRALSRLLNVDWPKSIDEL
jgi:formamidopyrimidine-DNA glycosylase